MCLVTNAANPVPNLTRAQLQDLVAGRITSPGRSSRAPRARTRSAPVALDLTTGARAVFLSVFVDVDTPVAYRPRTFATAAQVRDARRRRRRRPGATSTSRSPMACTRCPIDGVPCTRETIVSGAYPATPPAGLRDRGRPRGELARFLRWIARDATARRVIARLALRP